MLICKISLLLANSQIFSRFYSKLTLCGILTITYRDQTENDPAFLLPLQIIR